MQLPEFTIFGLLVLATGSPIPGSSKDGVLTARQTIEAPGINVSDLDLGDFEPVGEAFLEGDSDSGGEDGGSGDANSVANSIPGTSVGSGSSSFNGDGSTSGSSACTLLSCTSQTSAQNANGTSSSSSSSGLINAPLIENTAPLVSVGGRR